MRMWAVDTPDMSIVPQLRVLALYGGFFLVGWVLHRQSALVAEFGRITFSRVVIALISLGASLYLTRYQMDPSDPRYELAHRGFLVTYAFMMWSLVALTIGVFHATCRTPRSWIRYLADSSYWLYLVHLPVVVWLQVAVAELPWTWFYKLTGIAGTTLLVGLLTYDVFVRPTVLGALLNGRRRQSVLFKATPRRSEISASLRNH